MNTNDDINTPVEETICEDCGVKNAEIFSYYMNRCNDCCHKRDESNREYEKQVAIAGGRQQPTRQERINKFFDNLNSLMIDKFGDDWKKKPEVVNRLIEELESARNDDE